MEKYGDTLLEQNKELQTYSESMKQYADTLLEQNKELQTYSESMKKYSESMKEYADTLFEQNKKLQEQIIKLEFTSTSTEYAEYIVELEKFSKDIDKYAQTLLEHNDKLICTNEQLVQQNNELKQQYQEVMGTNEQLEHRNGEVEQGVIGIINELFGSSQEGTIDSNTILYIIKFLSLEDIDIYILRDILIKLGKTELLLKINELIIYEQTDYSRLIFTVAELVIKPKIHGLLCYVSRNLHHTYRMQLPLGGPSRIDDCRAIPTACADAPVCCSMYKHQKRFTALLRHCQDLVLCN
jgi:hypothetical protein